jgi:hypothetical protein
VVNLRIQPSEIWKLPVSKLEEALANAKLIRAEAEKKA